MFTEADHQDLARHLNLLHFYAEITKLEFVGFKEIPEVCRSLKYFLERNIFAGPKYFQVLLLRWAEDNELMVDKQLLAILFR